VSMSLPIEPRMAAAKQSRGRGCSPMLVAQATTNGRRF
jgi:hypothetical protein